MEQLMDIKGVRYDAATDTIEEFEYVGADKKELLKEFEKNEKRKEAELAELETKAAAKQAAQAKLAALGLTAEELQALGL